MVISGSDGGTFPTWTTATRPASPVNGQMGYNSTTGLFDQYVGSAWSPIAATGSVLQVIQTVNSTTYSSSSTGYVTPTGMSVSITPKFSTSKILILMKINCSGSISSVITLSSRLVRGSTVIGTAVQSTNASASASFASERFVNYLDSPATTSSTTYSCQFVGDGATWYINLNGNGTAPTGALESEMTLMEIAA
jgi:hypothetical protein